MNLKRFQSLIGILMNCNQRCLRLSRCCQVSIPNRDFDELQSNSLRSVREILSVSIPNRDFDELQSIARIERECQTVSIPNRDFDAIPADALAMAAYDAKRFQSLIGILMNCNLGFQSQATKMCCFNP